MHKTKIVFFFFFNYQYIISNKQLISKVITLITYHFFEYWDRVVRVNYTECLKYHFCYNSNVIGRSENQIGFDFKRSFFTLHLESLNRYYTINIPMQFWLMLPTALWLSWKLIRKKSTIKPYGSFLLFVTFNFNSLMFRRVCISGSGRYVIVKIFSRRWKIRFFLLK